MTEYKLIKLTKGYIIVSDENKKENDYVYHPGVSKKYTAVDITKKGNDRYTERNYIAQGIYKHIPTTNDWYLKERKIIASTFIPELPHIDFNNFEEEFGIADVKKLVLEHTNSEEERRIKKWNTEQFITYTLPMFVKDREVLKKDILIRAVMLNRSSDSQRGFVEGFNKCLELNKDKLYTEKNMLNMFAAGRNFEIYQLAKQTDSFKENNNSQLNDINYLKLLQPKSEWDILLEIEKRCWCMKPMNGGCFECIENIKITNNFIKIIKIL